MGNVRTGGNFYEQETGKEKKNKQWEYIFHSPYENSRRNWLGFFVVVCKEDKILSKME